MSDTIHLQAISTDMFERCQMNETPIRVNLPAGHPALDGTRESPAYVIIATNDGDLFDGYATDTSVGLGGRLVTTLEVS